MGSRPIGSFAASGSGLDAVAAQSVCSVQYKSIESFQAATLALPLPLGVFIPLVEIFQSLLIQSLNFNFRSHIIMTLKKI